MLGGQFTVCDGVTRHRLTRLNNDGTLDTMINFGDGADSFVAAVVIQTNGMIDLGGGFTHYDGQPRQHLARIYGGTIGGPGHVGIHCGSLPGAGDGDQCRPHGAAPGRHQRGDVQQCVCAECFGGFATEPSAAARPSLAPITWQ